MTFNAVQSVILVFPDERPVFLKEVNNNFYTPTAYFLAKIVSEIPASIITPVLFGCISYFSIHLDNSASFKFPVYCKFYISLNLFSWYNDLGVLRSSESVIHHFYSLCWQVALCYSDSFAHYSLHDVWRILRQFLISSSLDRMVLLDLILQLRVGSTHESKV